MNKHNKHQHDWYSLECTKKRDLSFAHRENRCLALPVLSMVLFTETLVADSGRTSADVPMRPGMACAQSQREALVLIKHSGAMQSRCGCKHLWVPGYSKPSGVTAYHWAQSGGPPRPLMQNRPWCCLVLTSSLQSARHRKQRSARACGFYIELILNNFKLFQSNVCTF